MMEITELSSTDPDDIWVVRRYIEKHAVSGDGLGFQRITNGDTVNLLYVYSLCGDGVLLASAGSKSAELYGNGVEDFVKFNHGHPILSVAGQRVW